MRKDLDKLQLIRPNIDLNGITFYIPNYQRGYRWRREHVETLLKDIAKCEDKIYCIQPLVVKKKDSIYIVADGQQRLTTLYLIYKALNIKVKFTFDYQTRDESTGKYLRNNEFMTEELEVNEVIDCHFIRETYKVVCEYKKNEKLIKNLPKVRFIWYPLSEGLDAQVYFDRLNMGRIPLTDAELIKALFLLDSQKSTSDKLELQQKIAGEWDQIERRLHNDKFWYFLLEFHVIDKQDYQVRIELILDLYSGYFGKVKDSSHKTFVWFENKLKEGDSKDLWNKVYSIFAMLEEWYQDDEIFHFAGFLMSLKSSDSYRIKELKELWEKSDKKSEFKVGLLVLITSVINKIGNSERQLFDADTEFISQYYSKILGENVNGEEKEMFVDSFGLSLLQYNDTNISRKNIIYDTLLLFNILELRPKNKEESVWANHFRFDLYKKKNRNKQIWSLEHIHSQNSSKTKGEDEINTIDNMALLTMPDNASNSDKIFVAKKDNIRSLDTKGSFIPQATKNIFMKYYSIGENNPMEWSENDRKCYFLHLVYTFNDNLK